MDARPLRWVYDRTIRWVLPENQFIWNNGVPIQQATVLDRTRNRPDYKAGSIGALREHVRPTDHVVVVGGGYGVSTIVAARRAASVTCYEAARGQVDAIRDRVERRRLDDIVTVKHRYVQTVADWDDSVWGPDESWGSCLPALALPDCDVLELDCEGAEVSILRELVFRPRVVIVEPHPMFEVEESDVIVALKNIGYTRIQVTGSNGLQQAIVALDEAGGRS